jgi:hypothetical protein
VKEILAFQSLKVMGYINRIIYLMFYASTIISVYGEHSDGNGGEGFYNPLYGLALIILGFIIFSLSFIGDLYRYLQDRKL